MSLPSGFVPVVQTFAIDQYFTNKNSAGKIIEHWQPYFYGDNERDPNWPIFIEAAVLPKNEVPRGVFPATGDLLDLWPRKMVYYGGPIPRYYAPQKRKLIEDFAKERGWAISTDVIPVQPNAAGMRYPRNDFGWYIAYNEQRPQKRYRYLRRFGEPNFKWLDYSFDTWKYANFHRANPNVT